MNKLTARQIKILDEIQRDEAAGRRTLEVAITYMINRESELLKQKQKIWNELLDQFHLDRSVQWITQMVDGCVCVIPKEQADE